MLSFSFVFISFSVSCNFFNMGYLSGARLKQKVLCNKNSTKDTSVHLSAIIAINVDKLLIVFGLKSLSVAISLRQIRSF